MKSKQKFGQWCDRIRLPTTHAPADENEAELGNAPRRSFGDPVGVVLVRVALVPASVLGLDRQHEHQVHEHRQGEGQHANRAHVILEPVEPAELQANDKRYGEKDETKKG
jgi:hypothetical protein